MERSEMHAIATLMNGENTVESYRIDDGKCSLFAIVMKCDGYFQIHYQARGGYGLYARLQDMILSNQTYKTLGGARRKLRKMGFAA